MSLETFPFPFRKDTFRYGTNLERARTYVPTEAGGWGGQIFDADEHYAGDLAERAAILRKDPGRLTALPHTGPACWDALMYALRELEATHPEMSLQREKSDYVWSNGLLGTRTRFREGDDSSLPGGGCAADGGQPALAFLGTQIQDDIAILDEREGALWLDAGLVTFAAGWSLAHDVGMRFEEVHGPVPRIHEEGIVGRAERFIMRLQPGEEYRRTNWSMTAGRRLDTSLETYDVWKAAAVPTQDLQLRVEVQHLIRLGYSGAVLFLIRTYLASLEELIPPWRRRFGRVLEELPDDVATYKGLAPFRAPAAHWLLGRPSEASSR
jgi:hypothetical protein